MTVGLKCFELAFDLPPPLGSLKGCQVLACLSGCIFGQIPDAPGGFVLVVEFVGSESPFGVALRVNLVLRENLDSDRPRPVVFDDALLLDGQLFLHAL